MILDKIVKHKTREVAHDMDRLSLKELLLQARQITKKKFKFSQVLKASKNIAVIAEIKKKSPSKGILAKNFKPLLIAKSYQTNGASCLSVLTDEKFFGGSLKILKDVKKISRLPILRKDFVIDEYQIYQAHLAGADAILLIAAILSRAQLKKFGQIAKTLGLDVLWEVHSEADVKKIAPLKPTLVGINNRNLKTFQVDIKNTQKIIQKIHWKCLVVSESGISTSEDLAYLKSLGVKAVLVGESFMKQADPGLALKKLLGEF